MSNTVNLQATEYIQSHGRKKRWQKVVTALASVAVFCTTYALIMPAVTQQTNTYCGHEEHTHSDECYEQILTLTCGLPEEGHTHGDGCYEQQSVLVCGLDEIAGHTHGDGCYEQQSVLVCENTDPDHVHGDECYALQDVLVCGQDQCTPHQHTEDCYELQDVLICKLPECESHEHSDACYEVSLNKEKLVCKKEEHVHTLQCYSCPTADGETREMWEESFESVELTGNWGEDVIAIAKTQLGYRESKKNYMVLDDGVSMNGITRYGQWYAIPYGDWCAMFCSFCIHYAGVENYPLECDCETWIGTLESLHLYHSAADGDYEPKPGDLVFFDNDWFDEYTDRKSDHVGFVCELEKDENGVPVKLVTIEGNCAEKVCRVEYLPDNKTILGYGEMIANPEYEEAALMVAAELTVPDCDCGSPNAELLGHSDKCARKAFLMDLCKEKSAEELHELWKQLPEDMQIFAPTYLSWIDNEKLVALNELLASDPIEAAAADGDVSATITGVFPADAAAELQDLDENSDELVKAYIENEMGDIGGGVFSGAIDIGLYKDGEKIDLNGETVSVAVGGFDFGGLWGDDLLVKAYHLKDTDAADLETLAETAPEIEVLPAQVDECGNIVFETDGFSVIYFTVDFHYLNGTYNLPCGESILLSELFAALGLDFDTALIESVEFSDPALLDITEAIGEDGEIVTDWELSTTIPFDSEESLTVTFANGQVLVISVTDEQVSGTYWQRVNSIDDTSANYLIVSVEGNYALTAGANGVTSVNGTSVKLVPVKGNPGYYTIDNTSNTMSWRFGSTVSANGGNTTIRRGSSGVYLYQTRTGSRYNYTYPIFNSNSGNEYLQYQSVSGTWTIRGTAANVDTRYLRLTNGTFDSDTSGNYQRNMIILKQVDTTLNIPADVTGGYDPGGGGGTEIPKPTYAPDTTSISGAKQGDITDVTEVVPDAGEFITGAYASDPSTSQIEDYFFSSVQNGRSPEVNDGKVLTDKSVIYGDDDYGAFSSYDEGTFGVALSALGQDYQLKTVDQVKIPVDVVFVLDVSGSMGNDAGGVTRRQAVVNAVNSAMTQIMGDNDENRAGVVIYSSGGSTLLGLDHYKAGRADEFLTYSSDKIRTAYNLRGTKSGTIDQTYGEVNNFTQSHGTYTQYGIALGAKLLQDNPDTTYTTTLNEGTEYAKEVTVIRQPVIILLSDGDPTHCTSNYMDVLSGPAYGSGSYPGADNNRGIQGYYTILSANYYKRMVGIHYNVPASFYTIGMGINTSGIEDMSGASATGDHYKRAVLNPTSGSISQLTNTNAKNYRTTSHQLRDLLSDNYDGDTVTVGTTNSYSNIGRTNTVVPVLPNPYSGAYSYADGAYFGNLSSDRLAEIFGEIITGSLNVKSYGFMLYQGTSVAVKDEIGAGMEIKGTPVLRYNGRNYTLTKVGSGNNYSYVCNATATTTDGSGINNAQRTVDLSEISIKVTTVNGVQTISMTIPESAVPSYTPEVTADWYYEELPVRLIYQVGLTDAAKTDVKNLTPGETLTYYTNAWENDTTAESHQYPHQDNPYYNNVEYEDGTSRQKQYSDYSRNKTDNTTETAGTSHDSEEIRRYGSSAEEYEIHVALGNNGKLTFENTAPSTVEIQILKVDMADQPIKDNAAEFKLYSDEALTQPVGETYTTDEDGYITIAVELGTEYYLVETSAPEGFNKMDDPARFKVVMNGDNEPEIQYLSTANTYVKVVKNQLVLMVENPGGYELPETGGIGLIPFYTFGTMLTAGALMYGHRKRRREGRAE